VADAYFIEKSEREALAAEVLRIFAAVENGQEPYNKPEQK
jgi:hypothetical protein